MRNQAQINTEVFADILASHTDGNGSIISFREAMVKAASYTWFESSSADRECYNLARSRFLGNSRITVAIT